MSRVKYDRLMELAKGQGLTVVDLAERSGVSRAAIYALRNPDKDVRQSTIEKLARAVHAEPADLIDPILASSWGHSREESVENLKQQLAQMQISVDSLEKSSVSHRGPSPDDAPYHHQLYSFIDALSESEAKRAYEMLRLAFDKNIEPINKKEEGKTHE